MRMHKWRHCEVRRICPICQKAGKKCGTQNKKRDDNSFLFKKSDSVNTECTRQNDNESNRTYEGRQYFKYQIIQHKHNRSKEPVDRKVENAIFINWNSKNRDRKIP